MTQRKLTWLGRPKQVLKWSFANLLGIAKRCGWLPAALELDEEWNHREVKIGDQAEVVRQIRNLVHAGNYIASGDTTRITKKYLEFSFKVIHATVDSLREKLRESLRIAIEREQDGD